MLRTSQLVNRVAVVRIGAPAAGGRFSLETRRVWPITAFITAFPGMNRGMISAMLLGIGPRLIPPATAPATASAPPSATAALSPLVVTGFGGQGCPGLTARFAACVHLVFGSFRHMTRFEILF